MAIDQPNRVWCDEGGGGEVLIGGTGGGSNLLGLSGPSGGPSSSPPPAPPTPEVPPPVAEAADPPSISITGVTVNESAGVATFTLTRLSGSGDAIVSVSTSDGTATDGGDYVAFSGNLTLSASATTVTFDVTLLNDFIIESDETFSATITAEQNATVRGGTATATISNDDSSLAIPETTAGSENPGSGTFTVTRTGFLDSTVTVQFSTADGNAIAGSDYTAASGTLTFGAGVSTQTITVPVLADQLFEGTERFTVSLGTVTGEVSTATSSVQARIVNDVSIRQDIFPLEQVNGGNGYVFNGITASDQSGRSVSFVGDVNNDGAQDFAIGAHLTDTNGADSGTAYILFGGTGRLAALDAADGTVDGSINLANVTTSNGFILNGTNQGDRLGETSASVGDVNGDGFADVLIGAPYSGVSDAVNDFTYLMFGAATGSTITASSLDGTTGFILQGIQEADVLGRGVAGVGDVNGDGINDFIIGAPKNDIPGTDVGQTYLVFGGASNLSALDAADSSADGTAIDPTSVALYISISGTPSARSQISCSPGSRCSPNVATPLRFSSGRQLRL